MTNTSSSQKQKSLLRILAIAGLVGVIILIAWLSVQIVRVAPAAFSSLASLAEGINQYEESAEDAAEPLSVAANNTTIGSGETSVIKIGDVDATGVYTFTYTCTDDVVLFSVNTDGNRELTCGTTYNLDENTIEIEAVSNATEDRNVSYEVGFKRPTDDTAYRTGVGSIVIIATGDESSDPEGQVAGETTDSEDTEPVAEVVTPAPQPEPVVEYVYQIPTSNPNGIVDLETSYVGVGDSSGLTDSLEKNDSGVLFFEVKNIGTKTSDDWRFTVSLPGNQTYTSERQLALKPNERATLALTIDTDDDTSHTFVVRIITDEDRTSANNSFTRRVQFTD